MPPTDLPPCAAVHEHGPGCGPLVPDHDVDAALQAAAEHHERRAMLAARRRWARVTGLLLAVGSILALIVAVPWPQWLAALALALTMSMGVGMMAVARVVDEVVRRSPDVWR